MVKWLKSLIVAFSFVFEGLNCSTKDVEKLKMDAQVGDVHPKAKMSTAARIRKTWWNTVYFNFGLFSMLGAPMLATVKLGFLNKLALKMRQSDLMLILSLQGIVGMTYNPLNRIIKMKYTKYPYESHKPLYILNTVSYMFIIIDFIAMAGILFFKVDGLPRNSTTYLELRAFLVGAIVIAPVSLALVYFIPAQYVGPVTIAAILVVLILVAGYVKLRFVQKGRHRRA